MIDDKYKIRSAKSRVGAYQHRGFRSLSAIVATYLVVNLSAGNALAGSEEDRLALFGDLHVHTMYSFDAFIVNVRSTPDDAYRFAKGEPISHALGYEIRLDGPPLDFVAVTDHVEYLGILPAVADPEHPLSKLPIAKELVSTDPKKIQEAFLKIGISIRDGKWRTELKDLDTVRTAWNNIRRAAEAHNEPGKFTTFIGYEYTSPPDGKNLHRNVIFRGSETPALPFSSLDSQNPEDLWDWLDAIRKDGIEALAIPHNSNASDGMMFELSKFDGSPLDADYARQRNRNEPLVEIVQVKGSSETHPLLSPNDEWANFELMTSYVGTVKPITQFKGGYVRDALLSGIKTEDEKGYNPFRFGIIGASDTHNAGAPIEERHFFGKVGAVDGEAERRGALPPGDTDTWPAQEDIPERPARYAKFSAAGLAGVWAEENTRESIYAALRRRETFATSGPRIKVRFFAGYDFGEDILNRQDFAAVAYKKGEPMGATLNGQKGKAPTFLVSAMRDASSGWLQRVQIVKGWIENGEQLELVYDVACSDGLTVDPVTHRCPDNGAQVDITTCEFSRMSGAGVINAAWRDPDFKADEHAFYYARVLENPSCRWSTWDAIRAGETPNPYLPATIQERAWTSPIWYNPR